MISTIGTGFNVYDTVLKEIERQNLSIEEAGQNGGYDAVDPDLIDELDNINEDAQQLTPDLYNQLKKDNEEINDNYTIIENFWDSNIQFNKEVKNSLRENNNILSLEDLIKKYEDGIYKDQEEFVEQIKKCNL